MIQSPQFKKYCEVNEALLAERLDINEYLQRKHKKPSGKFFWFFLALSCAACLSTGIAGYNSVKNANNNIAIVRVK